MPLIATRGAASVQGFGEFAQTGPANYIEDVFSTYLYAGNSSSQTITNNIDLSTKGGLVWIKGRTAAVSNCLFDTQRGVSNYLNSNNTDAASLNTGFGVTSFSTTGFSVVDNSNGDYGVNGSGGTYGGNYVSWTFREQPKFFDVVTYTGTGANRTIAHNLGSVPGVIIVKNTSNVANWRVYHRSLGATKYLNLNETITAQTVSSIWNDTEPTSTVFSVGTNQGVNSSGQTYVAYLFAHDAGGFGLTGSDNVISCGSYTGNGSATGPSINLGYEAQWVLIKSSTVAGSHWILMDNMRGISYTNARELYANLDASEISQTRSVVPTATGFQVVSTDPYLNNNGSTYVYIAIRRGPMKTPTTGTSVYYAAQRQDTNNQITPNFPADLVIDRWDYWNDSQVPLTGSFWTYDRLRGTNAILRTNTTDAEVTAGSGPAFYVSSFASNTQVILATSGAQAYYGMFWAFRRAPGFFDEVCYTGTGSATTVSHNLGVAPELMIIKKRSSASSQGWPVFCKYLSTPQSLILLLNSTADQNNASFQYWNSTLPTSTVFSLGNDTDLNGAGATYVAYLFASVAGVSKVGSYTGTGTTLQVDCGFTAGARFIMIKRIDSTGSWYVWDTGRGIVAGNDRYLQFNSGAAEVTNTDYVDTYSAGFEISSTAPAAINASGGTFIFLAIA